MRFYNYKYEKLYRKFKICIFNILIFINLFGKKENYKIRLQNNINEINNISYIENKNEKKFNNISNEHIEFCNINKSYWQLNNQTKKKVIILVEGFLAESGPNYLLRTGIVAKALEEISDAEPVALIFDSEIKEVTKKSLYQSFNINSFISMNDYYNYKLSAFSHFKIFFLIKFFQIICKILLKINARQLFFKLSFDKVQFGDILYDEMIKEGNEKRYTINKFEKYDYHHLKKAFVYFYILNDLLKKYKIKYYVSTHGQYVTYGLILRFFMKKNILSIETTDQSLFFYDLNYKKNPKYHTSMKILIKENLNLYLQKHDLIKSTTMDLNEKFCGKTELIDSKLAFLNKKKYTKNMLLEKLNVNKKNPIVFIFAHIFSDSSQGASESTIFDDYYQWLSVTIKYISSINNVNWVIKPHPSVKFYNEIGQVELIVQKYKKEDSSIFNCPDDFNPSSIINIANAIITCQGTVGIEYSCFGIPVILAGSPYYSGFGFTVDPKNKKEYFSVLKNIQKIKRLNEEQIKTALSVYACFNDLLIKDYNLIDAELRNKVLGADCEANPIEAYKMMNNKLKNYNPKESELFKKIIKYHRI